MKWMIAKGIVKKKNIHPYLILFCLYNQKRKTGVRIEVYNKPKGRKTEFKKKYRMANGKYLLILIRLAIQSAGFPVFSGRNYTFCYRRNNRFPADETMFFKNCSLFLSLFRCRKQYERKK